MIVPAWQYSTVSFQRDKNGNKTMVAIGCNILKCVQ